MIDGVIREIQRQLSEQYGGKFDAHYREGKGVLFVRGGQPLVPENVVFAVSEMKLSIMAGPDAVWTV